MVKQPVSRSLARALFSILLLSLLATGAALLTLSSSLRDAEAVNIAGSLRMQSYRLGYDLQSNTETLDQHRLQYAASLDSPVFQKLNRFWVPWGVRQRYQALHQTWATMDSRLAAGDKAWYQNNIAHYVAQIDGFVMALQHYAERKVMLAVIVCALGFITMFMLVFSILRRIRRQVVTPLHQLARASEIIEQGRFDIPPLNTHLPNELGRLARTYERMANELGKQYRSLEERVHQKTLSLQNANRTLEILYTCSQALNVSVIDQGCFEKVLRIARQYGAAHCLEMQVGDWQLQEGKPNPNAPWHSLPIVIQDNTIGAFRWQSTEETQTGQLMQSIANMLGRGLFFNEAQKHYQQLLLMEERATIARELHDSLAQSLSYLRIQLALLKRAISPQDQRATVIIADFSEALNGAYRQLRELLTTFRLTLQQADLSAALQEMLIPLRKQSMARISLDCRLPTQVLDAARQVHLLQIIREAVLNAIKHADASEITIHCATSTHNNHITIRDNGRGITSLEEPDGHYGLNIMQERAQRLGGELTISRLADGGTEVNVNFPARPPSGS